MPRPPPQELERALASGDARAYADGRLPLRLAAALSSEQSALASLALALQSVMSATQSARWAVYSWPFFPSPVDLLAAMEEEAGGLGAAAPAALRT
jgi:hypothetical protein